MKRGRFGDGVGAGTIIYPKREEIVRLAKEKRKKTLKVIAKKVSATPALPEGQSLEELAKAYMNERNKT